MAENNNNNMKFVIGAIGASALAYYVYCKYGKDDSNSKNKNTKKMVDKSKIIVVSADESHSKDIWTWRNDPITRKNSRTMDKVPWKNHTKWYGNFLKTKPLQMFICKDDQGNNICMVRFDKLGNGEYEISANLNPQFRGQRLSSLLIDLAVKHFVKQTNGQVIGIVAEIKPKNIPSIKCFTRAKFIKMNEEQPKQNEKEINSNNNINKCEKYYRKI